MGWTHYWERPTELQEQAFSRAVLDLQTLAGVCPNGVSGFDGTGEPVFEADHVVFNGQSPKACEPFEISRVEFDRRGRDTVFSYCKTERLPYDIMVQGALIVFRHHLGQSIRVTSDGDDAVWQPAREFVQNALGYGGEFRLDDKK